MAAVKENGRAASIESQPRCLSPVEAPIRRREDIWGGRENRLAKATWGPEKLMRAGVPPCFGNRTYLVSTQRATGDDVEDGGRVMGDRRRRDCPCAANAKKSGTPIAILSLNTWIDDPAFLRRSIVSR